MIIFYHLAEGAQNGAIILSRNESASSSYYYGIVRVYYNNKWGNICDDYYYNSAEANVICHQLGYTGASSYSRAGLVRLELIIINKLGFKNFCLVMELTLCQRGWMTSTVLVATTLLYFSVHSLHTLIMDVILTLMMPLCTAVSP